MRSYDPVIQSSRRNDDIDLSTAYDGCCLVTETAIMSRSDSIDQSECVHPSSVMYHIFINGIKSWIWQRCAPFLMARVLSSSRTLLPEYSGWFISEKLSLLLHFVRVMIDSMLMIYLWIRIRLDIGRCIDSMIYRNRFQQFNSFIRSVVIFDGFIIDLLPIHASVSASSS